MFYLWIGLMVAFVMLLFVFLRFTFVKEGTAKIVLQFGAFHGVLLAKKGYKINDNNDIVKGDEWHLPGGLRFVGFWPIYRVHKRDLKWVKALPGGALEDRLEKGVDFILARVDYQYGLRVGKAEDKDLLPLNIEMVVTARIVNPYKAQFAVKNWYDAMISRIAPYVREYISGFKYEDIIGRSDVLPAQQVMEELQKGNTHSVLNILKNLYGIEVTALETISINPEEEFRKASLQKWQATRDAEKRLGSTTGTLMAMIAHQTNQDLDKIQGEFRADPGAALGKYQGLIRMNKDFIEQQLAADAGALRRYYFHGGHGGLDLIALLGDVFHERMPGGVSKPAASSSASAGSSDDDLLESFEKDFPEAAEKAKKPRGDKKKR